MGESNLAIAVLLFYPLAKLGFIIGLKPQADQRGMFYNIRTRYELQKSAARNVTYQQYYNTKQKNEYCYPIDSMHHAQIYIAAALAKHGGRI